jgi:leucine efflux protein
MPGITDYVTFVVAVPMFLLVPGPGNLLLINSASKGGIRSELAANLDPCLVGFDIKLAVPH